MNKIHYLKIIKTIFEPVSCSVFYALSMLFDMFFADTYNN